MISRVRPIASHVHLPLRLLALCLDCDGCFEIGSERCPACGSATWTSLSLFLEQGSPSRRARRLDGSASPAKRQDEPSAQVRQLIIVARNREHLYEHLKRAFAGNGTVRVVLNRRIVERRASSGPYAPERRRGDRRSSLRIDGLLRTIGLAILPQAIHRGAPR
jgi:hypothetical protein